MKIWSFLYVLMSGLTHICLCLSNQGEDHRALVAAEVIFDYFHDFDCHRFLCLRLFSTSSFCFQFAVQELKKISDSGVYETLTLSKVISSEEEVSLFSQLTSFLTSGWHFPS
jgi:hypothetical protein